MLTKLSHQEARKILHSVDLPGGALKDLKFALASKKERLLTIREGKDEEDVRIAATIEIQRLWRGYYTRCMLFGILHPNASVISTTFGSRFIYSPSRLSDVTTVTPTVPHSTPQPPVTVMAPPIPSNALPITKNKYQEYCEQTVAEGGPSCQLISYREFCAVLIQQWWRLMLLKPVLPCPPPPTTDGELSADIISLQMEQEGKHRLGSADTVDFTEKKVVDRDEAARIIQRNWRKHIDMQVYRYYRDLINFKCRGDPSLMLKCINPREAELLDAAAGVHIKFRLAGEKFPPNIYYKIFTHRNIVDLCANAPRDYTQAAAKRQPAEYLHNRGHVVENNNREGWYQRWENNGWRLVSDRIMKKVDQDPVVYESTLKKEPFSHNKLLRRQDVERKRKKRKVEWMKKMYKEGMLKAHQGEDDETRHVVRSVAEGMFTVADVRGQDAVEDWEVDELLEWTNGLNFDQYLYDWKEVATSAGSEYQTEQTKYLPDDPFSLTLMSR